MALLPGRLSGFAFFALLTVYRQPANGKTAHVLMQFNQ